MPQIVHVTAHARGPGCACVEGAVGTLVYMQPPLNVPYWVGTIQFNNCPNSTVHTVKLFCPFPLIPAPPLGPHRFIASLDDLCVNIVTQNCPPALDLISGDFLHIDGCSGRFYLEFTP